MNDVFRGLGVQVELRDRQAFLIIVETLTRMGIPSARSNVLYQSAHLLHKRGLYAIMHFKELFQLDGKASTLTTEDVERRNAIAMLLEEWGLLTIVFPERVVSRAPPGSIKVIAHKDKGDWRLVEKYSVGRKRLTTG